MHPDLEFIHDFKKEISLSKDKPTFKYYHLERLHPPLELDKNLKFSDKTMPESRKSFPRSTKGSLKLMAEFIKDLKKYCFSQWSSISTSLPFQFKG